MPGVGGNGGPWNGAHEPRHDERGSAGSRVALFGGYGPDHDRLALAELGADRVQPVGGYRVVLPDEEPLPAGTEVIGRGRRLHFLTGIIWYQIDMDDIPA